MKTIVISGINLFQGGTLSIYKDCLDNIITNEINKKYGIIAFVHKKELFSEYIDSDNITFIELPKSRKSYLFRLYYEYFYFYFYSKKKDIEIWLSLHDITPSVKANKRYVYCHNPSPFLKTEMKNFKYSYKVFLFSLFYKYLYKINIKKNTGVIVQQDWIRTEFAKIYSINNIIVARPTISTKKGEIKNGLVDNTGKFKFIYAAFPRFFKNFEVICDAIEILNNRGIQNFEVQLTLDGQENKYSRDLKKKYSGLDSLNFIGLQKRDVLFEIYKEVDCMIFPSKLETWGLPISEFKEIEKPMLLADLPYSYETVGSYDKVVFFNPNDPHELAELMEKAISRKLKFLTAKEADIEQPYARNWKELLTLICKETVK